jgi:hypothetical protein
MRTLLAFCLAFVAAPLGAQISVGGVPVDTLVRVPVTFVQKWENLPVDSTWLAYCAPVYQRGRGVIQLDSLVPVFPPVNPTCPPRSAVILIRPACAFLIPEFLHLRYRALYIVIIARGTCAVGIPLRDWPQTDDVTTRISP